MVFKAEEQKGWVKKNKKWIVKYRGYTKITLSKFCQKVVVYKSCFIIYILDTLTWDLYVFFPERKKSCISTFTL